MASAAWNGVAKALAAAVGVAESPAERVAGATAGQPSTPATGERMAGSQGVLVEVNAAAPSLF